MTDTSIHYAPIGFVRSENTDPDTTPIQPVFATNRRGRVDVLPAYAEGLCDLDGFSHIWLVVHLHRAPAARLVGAPYMQDEPRGVFATRAPWRPNPIGLSVVRLIARAGTTLEIADVDILDGTPVLDIKPYIARFDRVDPERQGWIESIDEETARRRGSREPR